MRDCGGVGGVEKEDRRIEEKERRRGGEERRSGCWSRGGGSRLSRPRPACERHRDTPVSARRDRDSRGCGAAYLRILSDQG